MFVFQVIVKIACVSPGALTATNNSGILQQLANELHKNDILLQLNSLELLKDLALCPHGFDYLDNQGIVAKLQDTLSTVDEDPMAGFLLPGKVHSSNRV